MQGMKKVRKKKGSDEGKSQTKKNGSKWNKGGMMKDMKKKD